MRVTLLLLLSALAAFAQVDDNRVFPPFKIAANLYYVGTNDIACYLVTGKRGHALINSGYPTTPAIIASSIEQLGFKLSDVKFLLNSQAHIDHVGGQALVADMIGNYPEVWASVQDAVVIEGGGLGDFRFEGIHSYPKVRVSHKIKDGETLDLGETKLVAHITPGHTKGCTTWTLRVKDQGQWYDVVIVGGTSVNPGVRLLGNAKYPTIVFDYEKTFRILRALSCDIFLGAHGGYFGLADKYPRLKAKSKPNPFIDPDGYRAFIDRSEKLFRDQLAQESARNPK